MGYEIGSRIGDYEILEILGAGGMGRVYKVRNTISDRVEAMKVLLPNLEGNAGLADRFMREIKVQASLDHPNIAALHTALRLDNQLIMLMEYVQGTTLEEMMGSGPVPIDKAADYISQVLSALSYAHARGIVHRDLKPANMMVTAKGLVKLMDFGIAKMTADRKLTQTGSTVGSLYYMSPEQIKGALDLDPRSDLYSLGVSLYEVVTGARPFQGDSEYSIMAAHLQSNPPPPIQISPNLPPGLSEIILQALEKDPAKRFQTADAFRAALTYVCKPGQAAAAVPPPPQPSMGASVKSKAAPAPPPPSPAASESRPAASRRGLWIAVGAVIAIAVIVVAAMQIPKFRGTAAEGEAQQEQAAVATDSTRVSEQTAAPEAAPALESGTPAPQTEQAPVSSPSAAVSDAPQRRQAVSSPAMRDAQPALRQRVSASAPAMRTAEPSQTQEQVMESPRPEPVQASQQPAPAAASEDPAVAAQLKEVRKQLRLLSMRAETVRSGLDNLRRQQAASGLGLRADMTNAAQRMEHYFRETESALGERDGESAEKNLDLAEREVAKLEKFLHR